MAAPPTSGAQPMALAVYRSVAALAPDGRAAHRLSDRGSPDAAAGRGDPG
jgi:hypothetical protein